MPHFDFVGGHGHDHDHGYELPSGLIPRPGPQPTDLPAVGGLTREFTPTSHALHGGYDHHGGRYRVGDSRVSLCPPNPGQGFRTGDTVTGLGLGGVAWRVEIHDTGRCYSGGGCVDSCRY